jgi:phage protein D/phage baseplate assembly protein gpV
VSPAANQRTQTSPLRIKLNGADISPEQMAQVLDVTIEQDLVLPDAFAVRFRDTNQRPGQDEQSLFGFLDDDHFAVGGEFEVLSGREDNPASILKGEITSLEIDARADSAPIAIVRGYDPAYRLHRERKSRTFLNVSDADLARRIAGEHGLSAQAQATTGIFEHVFQDNQTDWEFLRARAQRIGFELFVRDRKLLFRKPETSGAPAQVEYLTTLMRLRLRLSAPTQVQEVSVKGWNPKTKQEVVGTARSATATPTIGQTATGSSMSSRLGTGKFIVSDPGATTQDVATKMAQSIFDEIAGEFIQLEGTCLGDPAVRPGLPLKVTKVGKRFSGQYYVSGATHKITADEGYMTHFVVSGRRPLTISALLNGSTTKGRAGQGNGKSGGYAGVVVGIVTNNKPPSDVMQGQIKVKFPWLANDESAWARLASPMAGTGRGFYWIPEVNDEVLVAFEQGDINRPYVIGCLWNGQDKPPELASAVVGPNGKVDKRIIKSRLGHTITIDDSDTTPSITIVDKTGNNHIKIDSKTNDMTAKVNGNMTLEALNTVTIKGKTVDVQATNDLKMKGITANLEATNSLTAKGTQTNIEGTANMTVKGAMTSVQGSASTEVKGAIVRIN